MMRWRNSSGSMRQGSFFEREGSRIGVGQEGAATLTTEEVVQQCKKFKFRKPSQIFINQSPVGEHISSAVLHYRSEGPAYSCDTGGSNRAEHSKKENDAKAECHDLHFPREQEIAIGSRSGKTFVFLRLLTFHEPFRLVIISAHRIYSRLDEIHTGIDSNTPVANGKCSRQGCHD